MDKVKILRLCNDIKYIVNELAAMCEIIDLHTHSVLMDKIGAISAEISTPPKSNGDRIRQMTDEELAEFFCQISQCCLNDAGCSMCPIYDGCAQNVMCVERWLKEDAGSKTD